MKYSILFLLVFSFQNVTPQNILEKEIKTEVKKVTVFLKGAQITREKQVDVKPGETIYKFTGLSPYIDSKSVRAKVKGDAMLMSVNHGQNFLDNMKNPENVKRIETQIEEIDKKLDLEKTHLEINAEQLKFLNENRRISRDGQKEEQSVENYRASLKFYSEKISEIKLEKLDRENKIVNLDNEKNKLTLQINEMKISKILPTGEIYVKLKSKISATISIEINYLVNNAGWLPSYDIRVDDIEKPVVLTYKANVHQNTKIDWKNVKLTLSSSNPYEYGITPELRPYYLNFNTYPVSYTKGYSYITGRITDIYGEPLIGANIMYKGTTIGTVADIDGNYQLPFAKNANTIVVSYVGFSSKEITGLQSVMDIQLTEGAQLQEVVVTGLGISRKQKALAYSIRGKEKDKKKNIPVEVKHIKGVMQVEFEVNDPYTIPSNGKNYMVEMENYKLPAYYEYYCVPKIEKKAYLMANITDWQKLDLLSGETNIFFEETFVGKSILDVNSFSDTLEISLGVDKNVIIKRDKETDFTSKKFIGTKKEITKSWVITVKNNKKLKLKMVLIDQIPIPKNDKIEVIQHTISKGKLNKNTGEVKWDFSLSPSEQRKFTIKYSAKFPKNMVLYLE